MTKKQDIVPVQLKEDKKKHSQQSTNRFMDMSLLKSHLVGFQGQLKIVGFG